MLVFKKLRDRLIIVLIISLIIGGVLLYCFVYIERGENAIIYILGEQDFDDEEFTIEELEEIEKEYSKYVSNYVTKFSDSWDWDVFICDSFEPDYFKYKYKTMLIFFEGHGINYNGNQYFFYTKDSPEKVKTISKQIFCNNLTIVVQSCYSVNWHYEFMHENLNYLFTNDLENNITRKKIFPEYTHSGIRISDVLSYNMFFINFLLSGKNYIYANTSSISLCYNYNLTGIDENFITS